MHRVMSLNEKAKPVVLQRSLLNDFEILLNDLFGKFVEMREVRCDNTLKNV